MAGQIYFVSDVHLGLKTAGSGQAGVAEREERFVRFLKGVSRDAGAVYLLGDIWDFWYEYRDVVPREGARVVAELIALMDAGVEVYFFPGNHDQWCYSFFEDLGIHKCTQPQLVQLGGKVFCLGHGDLLGGAKPGYRLMQGIFKNRVVQALFSTLHPWLAFRLGGGWSGGNRKRHGSYTFRGEQEPLYRFALEQSQQVHVDYFIFGHFHDAVNMELPTGARLLVLKDWLSSGTPHITFDPSTDLLTIE